jgi:plasmid stabilization system protein ParE
MKVKFQAAAGAELVEAITYYDARQPGLGRRFHQEILRTLDWVAANPNVPRLRGNYRRVNLVVFPYFIIYLTEPDGIWVVAVGHVHRKPGYWLGRMVELPKI